MKRQEMSRIGKDALETLKLIQMVYSYERDTSLIKDKLRETLGGEKAEEEVKKLERITEEYITFAGNTIESRHAALDKLLANVLRELGFSELIKEYESSLKGYSVQNEPYQNLSDFDKAHRELLDDFTV